MVARLRGYWKVTMTAFYPAQNSGRRTACSYCLTYSTQTDMIPTLRSHQGQEIDRNASVVANCGRSSASGLPNLNISHENFNFPL